MKRKKRKEKAKNEKNEHEKEKEEKENMVYASVLFGYVSICSLSIVLFIPSLAHQCEPSRRTEHAGGPEVQSCPFLLSPS